MRLISLILTYLLLSLTSMMAQEDASPVITADNIHQLQPVFTLNYADSDATLSFDRGWFAMSESASIIAVPALTSQGEPRLAIWRTGRWQAWDTVQDIATLTVSDESPNLSIALTDGENVRIFQRDFNTTRPDTAPLYAEFTTQGLPIEMWRTETYIGIELVQSTGSQILHITSDAVAERPYAPDEDSDAVVRIGRIPLPYVVTSSLEGTVTLWDVDQDIALATVDNTTGEPSVFGNINANATHLVWRDNANQNLYLLDFVQNENRIISDLYGQYAQWYFLSEDASVVLAVNLGFQPHVYAWHTHADETINAPLDLGAYRPCERPQPDMARLSADGTALVIGCDAGLQIWRVVPPQQDEE